MSRDRVPFTDRSCCDAPNPPDPADGGHRHPDRARPLVAPSTGQISWPPAGQVSCWADRPSEPMDKPLTRGCGQSAQVGTTVRLAGLWRRGATLVSCGQSNWEAIRDGPDRPCSGQRWRPDVLISSTPGCQTARLIVFGTNATVPAHPIGGLPTGICRPSTPVNGAFAARMRVVARPGPPRAPTHDEAALAAQLSRSP